ncbi:MAG TPA: aldehyde dehydrogenase family protein, partial [Candidatus Nanopelagicales bacterium]|nr:aldehyde dehydrogenase family protein [Candidatus Nanopelagicales bacterium]
MLAIPAILDNREYRSIAAHTVTRIGGEPLAELTLVPLVKTHEVVKSAPEKLMALQRTPAHRIMKALGEAAARLRSDDWSFASLSKQEYARAVSDSTGLPLASMPREIDELASILDRLGEITRVQLPRSEEHPLDTHRYSISGHEVGLFPAGESLLVKVPGNMPTIALYWLIPLALKRPVILVPPWEDPFTHLILVEAIRAVAPWLSSCVQLLPCEEHVFHRQLEHVDQIIVSQAHSSVIQGSPARGARAQFIHYGRSKLLVAGDFTDETVDIAIRRMLWKHGRTCTGLTSIIAARRGKELSERMAARLALDFADGLAANLDRLPLFHTERATQIDAAIEELIRRGDAEDMTRRITGRPRLAIDGGRAMLMPTVLWVKRRQSRAFGLELPFPFVTVAEAPDE